MMKNQKMKYLPIVLASMVLVSCGGVNNDIQQKNITLTVKSVGEIKPYLVNGKIEAIEAGEKKEITFPAINPQQLQFAFMFAKSDDWFFAPKDKNGLQLFDANSQPITGDITDKIQLWDNGTKPNIKYSQQYTFEQEGFVQPLESIAVSKLLKATLDYDEHKSEFKLIIENVSKGTKLETKFSPGVWAIPNLNKENSFAPNTAFFKAGEPTKDYITPLAETGNPSKLLKYVTDNTKIYTPIAPVLIAVSSSNENPFFKLGSKDAKLGLKELSQTGDPTVLHDNLNKMQNKDIKKVYSLGEAPQFSNDPARTISIKLNNNDKIYLATMFGYSTDWFYSNNQGITVNDIKQEKDVTEALDLYESGTAVDQYPGAVYGKRKVEDKPIAKVDSARYGQNLPSPKEVLNVTISVN